jgi:hypothetical protein
MLCFSTVDFWRASRETRLDTLFNLSERETERVNHVPVIFDNIFFAKFFEEVLVVSNDDELKVGM